MQESGGNQKTNAALGSLAEGIQGLVKSMRSEQQMMRDWVESQSQSQQDINDVLKALQAVLNKERR